MSVFYAHDLIFLSDLSGDLYMSSLIINQAVHKVGYIYILLTHLLWLSDVMWLQKWSILDWVMACCLAAPSHTWTNVDLSSVRLIGIYLTAIYHKLLWMLLTPMGLKMTYLKILWHLPEANEFTPFLWISFNSINPPSGNYDSSFNTFRVWHKWLLSITNIFNLIFLYENCIVIKFYYILFERVQFARGQHWFRCPVPSH